MEQFEVHINDPVAYESADEDLSDDALLSRAKNNLHVTGASADFYIQEASDPEYEGERMVYAHHLVIEGTLQTNMSKILNARVRNDAQGEGHQIAFQIRPASELPNFVVQSENILYSANEEE